MLEAGFYQSDLDKHTYLDIRYFTTPANQKAGEIVCQVRRADPYTWKYKIKNLDFLGQLYKRLYV